MVNHLVANHKALDIYLPEKASMEVVTERETKAQISTRQSKNNNKYLGSSCPTCNRVFNWKPALYKHMPACAKKSDQVLNSFCFEIKPFKVGFKAVGQNYEVLPNKMSK